MLECRYSTFSPALRMYSARSSAVRFVSVVTSTRSRRSAWARTSSSRSSTWFLSGLTSTGGSIRPVGRMICGTDPPLTSISNGPGVAVANSTFPTDPRNSSKFSGLLSSADGSLKPCSTSVVFLALSPLYMPRNCGIVTCDSSMIVRGLRLANFDCLVGINLLREGLDLPEVALVAVLDADKEGFLRSGTSLIQVAGRTARHINGKVILYADTVTDSMRRMIDVTERRRRIQKEYNERHHITPRSIAKSIGEGLAIKRESEEIEKSVVREAGVDYDIFKTIQEVEREMLEAAEALEFERAAVLRDELRELQRMTESGQDGTLPPEKKAGRSRKK